MSIGNLEDWNPYEGSALATLRRRVLEAAEKVDSAIRVTESNGQFTLAIHLSGIAAALREAAGGKG